MKRTIDLTELDALVGQELFVSDWMVLDQARINDFAATTGDHQWVHVDVERANREIGGAIAHGFLTLSMIPLLIESSMELTGVTSGLNLGADKLRFINPVVAGDRIRATYTLLEAEQRDHGKRLRAKIVVEIEGKEKPALVVELLSSFK